ncbi:hypothetical protein GCM10012275_12650 [Longimycelium tulufanense]|uniref:Superoxide dismutase n=1 Tax=Longimycelium tulufanense TaxID=907463 RepID=A0A8J3C6R8_9PSEU|nr:hypothetical protein GCM10012275_12650 [Longimycelium tulufanense]
MRPDYVEKLWTLVNWADVQRRFEAARAASNGGLWMPEAK